MMSLRALASVAPAEPSRPTVAVPRARSVDPAVEALGSALDHAWPLGEVPPQQFGEILRRLDQESRRSAA